MSKSLRFTRHYSVEEARQLIPLMEAWLEEMSRLNVEQESYREWQDAMFQHGHDLGGKLVEGEIRNLNRLTQLIAEFRSRELMIQNWTRGQVDLPSMLGGQEVLLTWERGQTDIIYWHALDTDPSTRNPV